MTRKESRGSGLALNIKGQLDLPLERQAHRFQFTIISKLSQQSTKSLFINFLFKKPPTQPPNMRSLTVLLLPFLPLLPLTSALGINCRGSEECSWANSGVARSLVDHIDGIDNNRWYNNGQQIACTASICAFLQNTGGTWGREIRELAHYIPDHGCKVCGSVPYFFPRGDNDVSHGELTFNFVRSPACDGRLC